MTMNDERESFSAALHEAARTLEPPDGELLYQRAVRHGRRLRRRKATGTALTGTVALGAAAALALGLSGVGADAPKPAPAATQAPQNLPKYMATTFQSLLPAGTTLNAASGVVALTGSGYGMPGNDGNWQASAQAFVAYQGERYSLELSVVHQRLNTDCETGFGMSACSEGMLGDGQFVLMTMGDGKNEPYSYWIAMNYAGGKSVELMVDPNGQTKNPRDPFTRAQLEQILTAPAWRPVLAALPALVDCRNLEPAPGKNAHTEWMCQATGKLYPSMGQMYP
jgi:hypothetical protein